MKRSFRLRGEREFLLLFRRGKRIRTPSFTLIHQRNTKDRARVACVVAKKTVRSAVLRNRLRRRVYEWIRQRSPLLKKPIDLAIVVGPEAARASRKKLYEELENGLGKLFP